MNEYLLDPEVCPASLNEDDEPTTEGETAHKWDGRTCSECGATREAERLTVKKLIEQLAKYPLNSLVYVDEAPVISVDAGEIEKSNGDGTFDAVILTIDN